MRNLEFVERYCWLNDQYWIERDHYQKITLHLENLENHLYNTKELNIAIDYFAFTSEKATQYVDYLQQEIETTKRHRI